MLALVAALLGVVTNAGAIPPIEESELNQGIVKGCLYQSGEFGLEVVRSCIDTETVAAKAVLALPAEHNELVLRCMQDFRVSGWSMVKNCVERALESGAETEER